MMAMYLAKIAEWTMKKHIYRFNDIIYKQLSGTPIGLQIAVNISRLVMIDWDQEMIHIMITRNIQIELFLRYVDDVNLALRLEQKDDIPQDIFEEEVAKTITEIADSIRPGVLKFEADIPSRHHDLKLPILDIKCWIKDDIIMFDFYKKDVNTDNVLGPNSGFTPKVLRNILLQEYL